MSSADLIVETCGHCATLPGLIAEAAEHVPSHLHGTTVERFVRWMPLRARQVDAALRRGA